MKSKNSTGAVVVIPTRNRAELAVRAIQSVLQQPVNNLRVIVSDNSTSEASRTLLAAFCDDLGDSRLLYVAPSRPLPMAQHWDWAMSQALQLDDVSHCIYLTDRSLFKPGELQKITHLASVYPDRVITYDCVTIFDQWSPITVERQPHTGQVSDVSASHLLLLSSRSIFPRCLPRMMNSCVPRSMVDKIQARFGSVFASIAPDYNFCYRCLESVDEILYYDQAVYVSYATHMSNGWSFMLGSTDTLKDFVSTLEDEGIQKCYAAPVPYFHTACNYIAHEYCVVGEEIDSRKFPKLRLTQYLMRNAQAIVTMLVYKLPISMIRVLSLLQARIRKVLSLQWPTIGKDEISPRFDSIDDAIDYAMKAPPSPPMTAAHLDLISK